jgi:signal recognition particle receptor subunit beta
VGSELSRTHGPDYLAPGVTTSVKIVVVGRFGVGKTTFIQALSEIRPLATEEVLTQDGASVDDLAGLPAKTTTTVAMDFGRITLADNTVLYLFGGPGQARFAPLLDGLMEGALGALVLADTERLEESFPSIARLENAGLPYAVALNRFDGTRDYPLDEVRDALDLAPQTPLVTCDARNRASAKQALIALAVFLLSPFAQEIPR